MAIVTKYDITLTTHNVKSHQDNDVAYENLQWEAKFNCAAISTNWQQASSTHVQTNANNHHTLHTFYNQAMGGATVQSLVDTPANHRTCGAHVNNTRGELLSRRGGVSKIYADTHWMGNKGNIRYG
jgi:hypothetical protein